jgi:23S rRNA (guanosine2251-2'-O)-methyltransferase
MSFFIYGIHPVLEALKKRPRAVHRLIVGKQREEAGLHEILGLAKQARIKVEYAQLHDLGRFAGSEQHQGIAADVEQYPLTDLHQVLGTCKQSGAAPLLLVLDSVQDPHNFGALVRSAVCAGCHGVIFPKDRSAGPTPAAAKASAGALEHVPLCRVTNIAATLEDLKKDGVWIAGTSPRAKSSIYSFDFTMPLAVVIGGEGKGMRQLVEKKCDFTVSIPLQAGFESLNASAAGAVILFEAARQRHYK